MPALKAPRKAYDLTPLPAYFDVLPFYKYLTKTVTLEDAFEGYYSGLNLPTNKFAVRKPFSSTRFRNVSSPP